MILSVQIYYAFDPGCHILHVCINSILAGQPTFMAPGNNSCQIPQAMVFTRQRSTTIILTCVNSAFFKACAESSSVNASSKRGVMIANRFRYYSYSCFSQYVGFRSPVLGMTPSCHKTLFPFAEPLSIRQKAYRIHKLVKFCCMSET